MSAFYAAVELVALVAITFTLHSVSASVQKDHDPYRIVCKALAALALCVAGLAYLAQLVGRFL